MHLHPQADTQLHHICFFPTRNKDIGQMNLFHLNTGVDSKVLLNADYDIRRYTDFISKSIDFLKRETLLFLFMQTQLLHPSLNKPTISPVLSFLKNLI